ncbi:MAG TPA: hypothetical protein VHY84_09250 [Bryobacteraceae bacterium]|jgi:hypothetical protein|nr:hypothetical protein [Bryobacteraceae bacterium]
MMLRLPVLSALTILMSVGHCTAQNYPAQNDPATTFANQLRADLTVLATHQTLGDWQKTHLGETPSPAGYQSDGDWLRTDFSHLHSRCALSIGQKEPELTRVALFTVPLVTAGKLPPLPTNRNNTLMQSCRVAELWVETRAGVSMDSLIRALAFSWGEPNGPSQQFRDAVWIGIRKDVVVWRRAGMNVWVINNHLKPGVTLAVYARNDMPADVDWFYSDKTLRAKVARESAPTLANIAALDPSLTKAVLARTSCLAGPPPAEDPVVTAERLERWLNASKSLTLPRRAAALMIADYYMSCMEFVPLSLRDRYERMGATFDGGCPQDPTYGHTFLREVEKIDKTGTAGQWATLADFWARCLLAYGKIDERGERLARWFPQWRPYIRYALARNHAAAMSLNFPGGNPEEGLYDRPPDHVDATAFEREREAAIHDFAAFLREKPADSESAFAWQEVWRLQAGLKPTRVQFGCSCE